METTHTIERKKEEHRNQRVECKNTYPFVGSKAIEAGSLTSHKMIVHFSKEFVHITICSWLLIIKYQFPVIQSNRTFWTSRSVEMKWTRENMKWHKHSFYSQSKLERIRGNLISHLCSKLSIFWHWNVGCPLVVNPHRVRFLCHTSIMFILFCEWSWRVDPSKVVLRISFCVRKTKVAFSSLGTEIEMHILCGSLEVQSLQSLPFTAMQRAPILVYPFTHEHS